VEEHAEEPLVLVEEHAEEPISTPTPAPLPAETSTPVAEGPVRAGLLSISDGEVHSDQVTLNLAGVTPPPSNSGYEAWLVGETEPPFSLGRLPLETDAIDYTFVDPRGFNLLGIYNRAFITIEPVDDPDPSPSDVVVFNGEIPSDVLEQIRLLVFFTPDTPDGDGFALNALAEALRVLRIADSQQQDLAEGNLANLRLHAESVINTIEGAAGPNYGDSDGDGLITDPSDGVGLLSFGDSVGYLGRTVELARLASAAGNASSEVTLATDRVRIAAENAVDWAQIIRDLELSIVKADSTAAAADLVVGVLDLATALAEGIDLNGDGQIAAAPGEGGVRTMYAETQSLGAIEMFATAAQPVTPTPELISEHAEEAIQEPPGTGN
jgi:hypothetical protein